MDIREAKLEDVGSYPESDTARARDAGVETETNDPHEAYPPFEHWRTGRPDAWNELPWVR